MNPHASRLLEQAVDAFRAGRLTEAQRFALQGTGLAPNNPRLLSLLGVIAAQSGRSAEGIEYLSKAAAIAPEDPGVNVNLGNLWLKLGQPEKAAECLQRATRLVPGAAEVHVLFGRALAAAGNPAAAAEAFRRVLALKGDSADAWLGLVESMAAIGQTEAALAAVEQARRIVPADARLPGAAGEVLLKLQRGAEALVAYRQAVALAPHDANVLLGLGAAQRFVGEWEEALASYRAAVARQPELFEAHANMANVLRDLGRVEEALAAHRRALALAPDNAQARFGYAYSLLLSGQFEEGWRHYEARWQGTGSLAGVQRPQVPQWCGEPLAGKSILLYHEQGFGDTIQCLRYLPLLRARGAQVTLELPAELLRLARAWPDVAVVRRGERLPAVDLACPMMSLPLAFGTTLATIPAAVPYLDVAPELVAAWAARLAGLPGKRVGLCWRGGRTAEYDRVRSLNRQALAPLAAASGMAFIGLQKDASGEDGGPPLVDFASELADFAETAALVANLDLVISVDTAVAHLAGALGRPVWLLNRYNTEWRWLRERSDSPWYPTMRIFRQRTPGDWSDVVAEVARELESLD